MPPLPGDVGLSQQERAFILRHLYSTSSEPRDATTPSSQLPPFLPFGHDGTQPPSTLAQARLDHEAQFFLAQVLRAVILAWYSKLTPDRELLGEMREVLRFALQRIHAVFHCHDDSGDASRRLNAFLNLELPAILSRHYRDVRRAEEVAAPNDATVDGIPGSCRALLAANPHVALSLVDTASIEDGGQSSNSCTRLAVSPLYLGTLVDSLLEVILPPSHLASQNERFVVRDVIVGILRGSVLGRVVKPWSLVGIVHRALDGAGVPAWDKDASPDEDRVDVQRPAPALPAFSYSTLRQSISRAPSLLYLLLVSLLPPLVRFYLGFFTPKALNQAATERRERQRRARDERAKRRSDNVSAASSTARHGRSHSRQSTDAFGADEVNEVGIGTYGEELEAELDGAKAWGSSPATNENVAPQEEPSSIKIDVLPLLDLLKEVAELESTASGRQLSAMLDFAMTLGGEKIASRLLSQRLESTLTIDFAVSMLSSIRQAALPGGVLPPPAPPDPDVASQRGEFDRLVRRFAGLVGNGPASYLLGFNASQRAHRVRRILSPIFGPPPASSSSPLRAEKGRTEEAQMSTAEIANVRTTVMVLERVLLLLRPEMVMEV